MEKILIGLSDNFLVLNIRSNGDNNTIGLRVSLNDFALTFFFFFIPERVWTENSNNREDRIIRTVVHCVVGFIFQFHTLISCLFDQ